MKALKDLNLQERDRLAIEEAAELIRKRCPVESVLLFGSKARGDDDAESDIDLLVLTARPVSRSDRHAVVDALFPIQLRLDVVLSPLFVDAREWREGVVSVLPIRREIEEHGVVV